MKTFLYLLILAGGMLLGRSALAQPPGFPPPFPVQYPTCPTEFVGQVDGIYYYIVKNCPDNGPQNLWPTWDYVDAPCCKIVNGSWSCDCGEEPPMAPLSGGDSTQPQTMQFASAACLLPQGTETEINAKLAAIVAECQAREAYLRKLAASPEIQGFDALSHKGRIQTWLVTVSAMVQYLSKDSDSAVEKITNYCQKFYQADQNHQRSWRTAYLLLGDGKTQSISNLRQPRQLLASDKTDFTPGKNVTSIRGPIAVVSAIDAPGGNKVAYFQTFKVFHSPPGQSSSNFQIGVQCLAPANGAVEIGVFVDRHNFGHKIRISSGATYLVSSQEDLAISQ